MPTGSGALFATAEGRVHSRHGARRPTSTKRPHHPTGVLSLILACPAAQSPVCLRPGMLPARLARHGLPPRASGLDPAPCATVAALVGLNRRCAQIPRIGGGASFLAAGPRPDCSPGPRGKSRELVLLRAADRPVGATMRPIRPPRDGKAPLGRGQSRLQVHRRLLADRPGPADRLGMVLHAFGIHHLQHGRDGRLGTTGGWIFAACSSVIVVQCMASLIAAAELRWGPSYPPLRPRLLHRPGPDGCRLMAGRSAAAVDAGRLAAADGPRLVVRPEPDPPAVRWFPRHHRRRGRTSCPNREGASRGVELT